MNWRDIEVPGGWCLGANDEWGTCAFAMVGNHAVLLGKGVMNDGEVLNAARQIEGLNTQDRTTDKGENLEALFRYIQDRGWPGDPTFRIASWRPVELPDIAGVIEQRGACEAWLMLPMTEDGTAYAFEDETLSRGARGVYAHAVLIVEDDGRNLTFITWARPQTVSRSWWEAYGRQAYDVEWRDVA